MTPPRLTQLKCPQCQALHWTIDCDYRGITAEFIAYAARDYRCGFCGFAGKGFIVQQQSPPAFLLQPHPMYPMTQRAFEYWAAILQTEFPDHPQVARLGDAFRPNTHILRTRLRNLLRSAQYDLSRRAKATMADVEDRLDVKLLPDIAEKLRRRAAQTAWADIHNSDEVRLYVSYSHTADDSRLVFALVEFLQGRLNKMLKTSERTASGQQYDSYRLALHIWCNRLVTSKSAWYDELEASEFRSAGIILALLSPQYLASDVCRQQWQQAETRKREGAVRIVPILLRPVVWDLPTDLRRLPTNSPPISECEQREEAFEEVAQRVLEEVPAEIRERWVDPVPYRL